MQPTRPVNRKRKKNKSKKPWIIGAAIVLLLIVVFGSGGDDVDVTANNVPTQNPTSAPTINPDNIERNTTEMVDYLIASAKEPALNENAKTNAEKCYSWIVANVDSFFTDDLTMETAIYSGAFVEAYYTGKDDVRAAVGMDTIQAVKYVYRGVETAHDDATRENIQQIKDGIVKAGGTIPTQALTQVPAPQPTAASSLFPQTIFDMNGVKISVTGFDKTEWLGPEIKLTVENNSGINLYLVTGELYCDGWQLKDFTCLIELANGSKTAETITIYESKLEECGLRVSDLKNVIFKNATLRNNDDYSQSYTFEMSATLQ